MKVGKNKVSEAVKKTIFSGADEKVIRQKQRTEKEKGRQRSQFLLEADEKSKKAV
jgi:hypothetical protein